MGFSEEVSKYHKKLSEAILPHKGKILGNPEIKRILVARYPELKEKEDWILPSDHCRTIRAKVHVIAACLTKRFSIESQEGSTWFCESHCWPYLLLSEA